MMVFKNGVVEYLLIPYTSYSHRYSIAQQFCNEAGPFSLIWKEPTNSRATSNNHLIATKSLNDVRNILLMIKAQDI